MGEYNKAEVCLNGHPTTGDYAGSPEFTSKYCSKCGAETTRECPSCQSMIRGYYDSPGVISFHYESPSYCHSCGGAYPWTQAALEAAKELVEELDELSRDEKDKLSGSVDVLVQDSPKAQVAAVRFKKLMGKAGTVASDAMGKILVNVVSEAIKKQIF